MPAGVVALQAAGIEVVAPLTVGDRLLGLLAAGKRWDEEIFDDRDLEIIELITQQATMFALEAIQIQELRQVPRRVADAEERERTRLAQELHDTIQQFLGRLPFFLEVSRTSITADPAATDLILQRCIQDVESAAQAVRQIRHNLSPTLLERGLIDPLQALVERFRQQSGIEARLELATPGEPPLSP
jgi:signal transduction histidine kinase